MKFQRFLILVFAAALTAGTCGATSVLFNLYVGSGGNQAVPVGRRFGGKGHRMSESDFAASRERNEISMMYD